MVERRESDEPGDDATAELVEALRTRGLTIAVAESLTGGAVTAEIVRIPGASAVLRGGVVAYSTALKETLLGVDGALLAERGAVDPAVAASMADGVRRVCAVEGVAADVGVATTGVAGPDPQDAHPPGTVFIGVSTDRGRRVKRLALTGSRADIRLATVQACIAEALAELGNSPPTRVVGSVDSQENSSDQR